MRFYLGIDGGQSSTTLLIADESGRVIGSSKCGPCNHVTSEEAPAKFGRVISGGLQDALNSAHLSTETVFESVCAGLSGGNQNKSELLSALIPARQYQILPDFEIALAGATAGEPGIMVIAGTGSVAFGRNSSGATARAGGWGYIYGDEGAAFDIAREGLRAALRLEEGWGAPTAIREAFLDRSGAASANELLHLFYTPDWPRARVAEFAILIDSIASTGDLVARAILESEAQTLASLSGAVRGQIFGEHEAVMVASVGGVFRSALLLERFRLLIELTAGCRCISPVLNPAAGALLRAFEAIGQRVTLRDVPTLK